MNIHQIVDQTVLAVGQESQASQLALLSIVLFFAFGFGYLAGRALLDVYKNWNA